MRTCLCVPRRRLTTPMAACLLLLAGDKRLFIRSDELEAAWDLFTPILHELEAKKVRCGAVRCGAVRGAGKQAPRFRDAVLVHGRLLQTPVVRAVRLPAVQVAPELYPYGSRGPVGAHYLAAKYGVRWGDLEDSQE